MPELPDIVIYTEALASRIVGQPLAAIRMLNPFLLRTASPSVESATGKRVTGISRLGKRIVIALEGDMYMVIHLMIAGRLRWLPRTARPPGRITQAVFEFPNGQLVFTEAGHQAPRVAAPGAGNMQASPRMIPGGIDAMSASTDEFAEKLVAENHTLKRVLTDPHVFSGIGKRVFGRDPCIARNCRRSRIRRSWPRRRSRGCTRRRATCWPSGRCACGRRRARIFRRCDGVPAGVRGAMESSRNRVPVCGAPVQRIVYAENETNYCARCQTGGVVLADRALSRLLQKSWPRSIDDLE